MGARQLWEGLGATDAQDEAVEADAKTYLQHAVSVRGLVESGLPSLVFVILFRPVGTSGAAFVALGVAGAIVLERLLRRQRPHEALSGVLAVVLSVVLAVATGDAKNYFLPEVVMGLVGSLVLLGSIAIGRPLLGVLIGAVAPPLRGWRERPVIRRALVHVTAVAGVWAGIKALFLLVLYLGDSVELLAAAKLALGYPVLGVLVLYYFRVLRRALAAESAGTAPASLVV